MPIYEYQCENGHHFEALQKMADPALDICTICSGQARRKPSVPNLSRRAGVYIFDREHGGRDILHDPSFSDRERDSIISDAMQGP